MSAYQAYFAGTLVDQDRAMEGPPGDERAGIEGRPVPLVRAQVTGERLAAPGAARWRRDRREGRDRAVLAGLAQRADERADPRDLAHFRPRAGRRVRHG